MPCYDDAMRTIVELPDERLSALRECCAHEGAPGADAERMLAAQGRESRQGIPAAAFGSWKELDIDSVDYVRGLREEWERTP